jgi:hypothetical protein
MAVEATAVVVAVVLTAVVEEEVFTAAEAPVADFMAADSAVADLAAASVAGRMAATAEEAAVPSAGVVDMAAWAAHGDQRAACPGHREAGLPMGTAARVTAPRAFIRSGRETALARVLAQRRALA